MARWVFTVIVDGQDGDKDDMIAMGNAIDAAARAQSPGAPIRTHGERFVPAPVEPEPYRGKFGLADD